MNAVFLTRIETQLKQWDEDFAAVAHQGENAGAHARDAYHERLEALRGERAAMVEAFGRLRGASEAEGAAMLPAIEGHWNALRESLARATAELEAITRAGA